MHHGTCVTLTRGGGENIPGIPGACAIRKFTYLARGPWRRSCKTSCHVSSHGNVFCVTGSLWEESADERYLLKMIQNLNVSFVVTPNELLNKPSSCRCFEKPRPSCDVTVMPIRQFLTWYYWEQMLNISSSWYHAPLSEYKRSNLLSKFRFRTPMPELPFAYCSSRTQVCDVVALVL